MKPIYLYIIASLCLLTACHQKVNCTKSQEKHLGQLNYSEELLTAFNQLAPNAYQFTNKTKTVRLEDLAVNNEFDNRFNSYEVCRSIDIKPQTYYAYYSYANKDKVYSGDTAVIAIEPRIELRNSTQVEGIYLNLGYGISNSFKGFLPISGEAISTSLPIFLKKNNFTINNETYSTLWVLENEQSGMYVTENYELIAIKMNNELYFNSND